MLFQRYQVVRCKITGQKMMIKDIINKDFPDEKYNCKYLNRTSGLYEYVHKTGNEIEPATSVEVGFKSESPSSDYGRGLHTES